MKITDILNTVSENENSAFFFSPAYYKEDKCYLFTSPDCIYSINSYDEFIKAFSEIEILRKDHIIAALLNYEAGYLFEDKFKKYLSPGSNEGLITLLCYKKENCTQFESGRIIMPGKDEIYSQCEISNLSFNVSYEEYINAVLKIKKYIYEGDTYQVNYTVKSKFGFNGSLQRLFLNLTGNQSTKYSAFINLKDKAVISVSPELFFEIKGEKIITRPMKGTLRRGINLQEDLEMKNKLFNSEKDRAENVMIVDLLRNDFGKISKFGSVKALSLFDIEKYESVFQMTSAIESQLQEKSLAKIIENVYPCGSITGAPKIRTMEIIKELEKEERGIYTGSIGLIMENSALFNVAIRTLVIDKNSGSGEMGLGGGIVWDSVPDNEYKEMKLKGKFLTRQDKQFQLIETILFEDGECFLLEGHLERLSASADYFLFKFDESNIKNSLADYCRSLPTEKRYKVRLLLNKTGEAEFSSVEISPTKGRIKVILSDKRTGIRNKFQYFKTTERDLYDSEYNMAVKAGFFDTIFLNDNDELTEGAISNIFLFCKNEWSTPHIQSGLLAGCYRETFIIKCNAVVKKLSLEDLKKAEKIVLVNSVRKEVNVDEIWQNNNLIWEQTQGECLKIKKK